MDINAAQHDSVAVAVLASLVVVESYDQWLGLCDGLVRGSCCTRVDVAV